METDVSGGSSRVVLKTVSRMPRIFISQLYAVDMAVAGWVSLGSLSYAACAFYLERQRDDENWTASLGEQISSVAWTFQVQTAAFGASLLLNLLNLGMRQHLLPFKCNLLLLYINGVAFMTDLLLWRGATTILMSSSGRPFAPLRYVQWCHSTPTMIYMLALLADCGGWQLTVPLLSDVVMVMTGLLACYTRGVVKDVATVLSFGTFVVVLYYVRGMFDKTLSGDVSSEQRSTLRTVLVLLLALWSAFPVVWLAAEWQLMGPQAEAVCWGVCDYLAKVVFSSQLWQTNLTEVQLRRDRALEAWEASNRVEAVARLTALLKQRDDLLSTLSHELRTPLAGIVALSEGLCQEVSAALPSSAQTLATVRATATCMLNIVTSTLDSFAARRGGEPAAQGAGPPLPYHHPEDDAGPVAASVPLRPLDLRPLVETVTNVLRPLAHDGVVIVSDLPANLPPVAADVTRLSQVLYNLVGNAMRFTAHGEVRVAARVVLPEGWDAAAAPGAASARGVDGPGDAATPAANSVTSASGSIWRYARPRISMSSTSSCSAMIPIFPEGTLVEVSVEDTGVGIAQELLDELFMPYRTGHAAAASGGDPSCESPGGGADGGYGSASRSIGGTGLGLYLVRLALRAQGSDISAESAPGIGSVFRFRLPVVQQPPQQQQQQRQPHHSDHHQANSRQPHRQRQRRGASLDERRRGESALLGSKAPLSSSTCEYGDAPCSSSILSAANAEGSGADRALSAAPASPKPATLSSPKPMLPLSPRPWIASATARLVKLSRSRVGSSGGGAAGAAATTAAPQRPSTGVLALQESSSSPISSRQLRMSLDEQHSRQLRMLPQPRVTAGGRARFTGAAGQCVPEPPPPTVGVNCAPEPPPPVGCGAALADVGVGGVAVETGSRIAADAAPTSNDAATSGGGGSGGVAAGAAGIAGAPGLPVTMSLPVVLPALTPMPAPTPTAAARWMAAASALPVTASDAAHVAVEEARAQARSGLRPCFRQRNNGTLQVLSVDDDPINQLVAGQMLISQAWKVVKCMNGPDALAHLQLMPRSGPSAAAAAAAAVSPTAAAALAAAAAAAQPLLLPSVLPDCVLLDVMMPGMSGFEVCRKLRQHFSSGQLPIIIVSAKGDSAAVDEAFESGADDYMTKPYKRAEMVARIKAQIRTRDSIMDAAAAAAPPPPPQAAAVCSAPPHGAAAAPPPVAAFEGAVTGSSNTPRACSSAMAAHALMGSGAGLDLASPPPQSRPPPPQSLMPFLQTAQDDRPTSVDVLLLQRTTPDSIKTRMEASRGGLDGSWGKVGLYKRERALSRTGGVPDPTAMMSWDSASRPELTKESVTAPAAVLDSPCAKPQPGNAGSAAAAAATSHSTESSGVLYQRPPSQPPRAVTVDASVGTSRPLPALPEDTAIAAAVDSEVMVVVAKAAAPRAGAPHATVLSGGGAAAVGVPTATSSAEVATVTAANVVPAASNAAAADGGADGEPVAAAAPAASNAAAAGGSGGEPMAAAALILEVLTEVRRGRAVEADIEKLTSRVATLGTACSTLTAERDGWRRQAVDLRALLATGLSNAAAEAAAAASGTPGSAKSTALHLAEALAASQGSRSSGDSLIAPVGLQGGTQGGGSSGVVGAQLEGLKKEAALLRQQLSMALASVGNGSVGHGGGGSGALGHADTGGSRMSGLMPSSAGAAAGAAIRQQRSVLPLSRPLDSTQSATMMAGAVVPSDTERSGGGGAGGGSTWGVSVFPNPTFAPPPSDMFLTTETSGLSAGSGHVGCVIGDGKPAGPPPAPHLMMRSPLQPCSGADANATACRHANSLLRKTASPPQGAAAAWTVAGTAAAAGTAPRVGLVVEGAAAASQANGLGGGGGSGAIVSSPPPLPPPGVALGSSGAPPLVNGAANVAAAVAAPVRADPSPQVAGELRGSSAPSNGGRRSSVEEEMSQPSSAGGRVSAVPLSLRGSRSRGGGAGAAGGSTGGGGILRLLCSKGALPAGSPRSSPTRRLSQPQQQ